MIYYPWLVIVMRKLIKIITALSRKCIGADLSLNETRVSKYEQKPGQ